MAKTIDVSAAADLNPYVFPAGWTNLVDDWRIVSGVLRPTFSSTGTSMAIIDNPPATGTLEVTFEVNHDNTLYSDTDGAVFVTPAGTGYCVEMNGDRATVRAVTAGVVPGSELGHVASLVYASGDEFKCVFTIAGAASTIDVYQLSVSAVVPALTVTTLAHAAGMAGGIFSVWNNSGAAGIISTTINEGATHSLDTITSPVTVGGTGYTLTTTGMDEITDLSFASKAAIIDTAIEGSATWSMPEFVHGVTYPTMGSHSFTAGDGTLIATRSSTVNTMAGYTAVTMSTMDTGEWSIGQDPAIVATDVIHLPTAAGTLNNDGTLTDYVFGTYTMWRREAATGTMYTSQLIISESGISIDNGVATRHISKRGISVRHITSAM